MRISKAKQIYGKGNNIHLFYIFIHILFAIRGYYLKTLEILGKKVPYWIKMKKINCIQSHKYLSTKIINSYLSSIIHLQNKKKQPCTFDFVNSG